MSLSNDQQEQAKSRFYKKTEDIDEHDMEYASKKGQSKFDTLDGHVPEKLTELWDDLKYMILMITDYVNGSYREVPWKTIAALTGAVIYFIWPFDVIPDVIPIVGYADDAVVIGLALKIAREDLDAYKIWKKKQ